MVLVVALVLIGTFFFFWTPEVNDTPAAQDDTEIENGTAQPPEGYQLYSASEFGFDIFYPADAMVSREANTRIKFTFLGPNNEPNTEITDGFTLTIHQNTDAAQHDTLAAYAEARVEAQRTGPAESTISAGLEQRQVNGMAAYRYTFESALGGSITEYIFMTNDGQGYTATYSVSDPQDRGYEQMVLTMLESLQLFGTDSTPVYDDVDIALLDHRGVGEESEGAERGCDRVVLVNRSIDPTTAPLTAALSELFSLEDTEVAGWHNFIAETNDTLSFDHATVTNGTASIYLEGELSGLAGVCDNPRAAIQIEETALQFSTVDRVQLYLNGEPTDLVPSERSS